MSVITTTRPVPAAVVHADEALQTLRVLPRATPVVANEKSKERFFQWWMLVGGVAFIAGISVAVWFWGGRQDLIHSAYIVNTVFHDPERMEADVETIRPPPADIVVPIPVIPELPNSVASQFSSEGDVSAGIALPAPGTQAGEPEIPLIVKSAKADEEKPVEEKPRAPVVTVHNKTDSDEPLFDQAEEKAEQGDDQGALKLYNKVLANNHSDREALSGKAFVLQRMGRYEEAVVIEHRLLKLDPEDKTIRENLAAALGTLATPAASDELKKMIADKPDFIPAHAALALALAHQGDGFHALPHAQKAVDAEPGNMLYRLDLAVVYDRMGHSKEAIGLYAQVIDAYKSNINVPAQNLPSSLATIRERVGYLRSLITSVQDTGETD